MKIETIKKRMLAWRDFYGSDIMQQDVIEKASTKTELASVLRDYRRHMEDRQIDAMTHFDSFAKELNIF